MEEKFGIENLKKIIAFVIAMGNVGDKIGQGNRADWKKWTNLIDLFGPSVDLVKCNFKALKDEFKDLSAVEKEEIASYIKEKFDIHNEKLEMAIEGAFSIGIGIEEKMEEAIDLFRSLKA